MQQLQLELATTDHRPNAQLAMLLHLPVTQGIRGAAAQHLVFLTGEHLLDVQVDYQNDLTIVGQIVNKSYTAVSDATVQAVSEHGVLDTSTTGSGGEFLVACRPRGTMRLCISVSDVALIELPLPREDGVH